MTLSLTREPTGNVVLRAGTFTMRHDINLGGCPLEWYQEPYPVITNPYKGSGCSCVVETGQDPTEALGPIASLDGHNPHYNYYGRETIFDVRNMAYTRQLFAPDCWHGIDPIDNYLVTGSWHFEPPLSFVFYPSPSNMVGIMCPGNEMEPGQPRVYADGHCAAMTSVDFGATDPSAHGGLLLGATSKGDGGYLAIIRKDGNYHLLNRRSGKSLLRGKVSARTPFTVELRTHTAVPGYLDLFINQVWKGHVDDTQPQVGPTSGIYAGGLRGDIWFTNRAFYDLNTQFIITWRVVDDGLIESEHQIITTPGCSPITWWRAGTIGIWLSKEAGTYPQRFTGVLQPDGKLLKQDGIIPNVCGKKLWCGNPEGTLGVLGYPTVIEMNGQPSPDAHALIAPHVINDEFIQCYNALPLNYKGIVSSARQVTEWRTHI